MVGVPRSRGCDACRQQKKKCIVIPNSACSRCKRLDISCVGCGERRLKFQDESRNFMSPRRRAGTTLSTTSSNAPQSTQSLVTEQDVEWNPVLTVPINILSSLIASFIRSVDGHDADTGYHLTFNFGVFLHNVPQYLGSNESLDTAADALVVGYDHFRRYGSKSPASVICLGKYSQAVKSLRRSLSTVEDACEPATLCAIQIVMVVEALIGISNASPLQHAGGAAKILKCRGTRPPKDELERILLMTLRGPVVFKAFFLDESFFTETEWNSLVEGFSVGVEGDGFFPGLATTARLFQRTRRVLSQQPQSQNETERLILYASNLHDTMSERLSDLSSRLDKARNSLGMPTKNAEFTHSLCTRNYGLALSTQILVNCILMALLGVCGVSTKRENASLCQDICNLGENDAMHHRPLGSGWIIIALGVAYIGVDSVEQKNRVARLMNDYTHDFSGDATEAQTAEMQLEQLAAYLSCGDLTSETKP